MSDLVLEFDVQEDFKWYQPCYKIDGKNIIILGPFKDFCALIFSNSFCWKILKTCWNKWVKIHNLVVWLKLQVLTISEVQNGYRDLIKQAINNEKEGKKVAMKAASEYEVTEELKLFFNDNSDLNISFKNLTPRRQRAYLLHFSPPKQSKTRFLRIKNFISNVMKVKCFQE